MTSFGSRAKKKMQHFYPKGFGGSFKRVKATVSTPDTTTTQDIQKNKLLAFLNKLQKELNGPYSKL